MSDPYEIAMIQTDIDKMADEYLPPYEDEAEVTLNEIEAIERGLDN